jgi:hypothetical protein
VAPAITGAGGAFDNTASAGRSTIATCGFTAARSAWGNLSAGAEVFNIAARASSELRSRINCRNVIFTPNDLLTRCAT